MNLFPAGWTAAEYGFTYHTERATFYGLTRSWPNPHLYRVDPVLGHAITMSHLRSATQSFDTAEGIAYSPDDGLLYVSVGHGFYSRWLGTVDPDTAVVTVIGQFLNDFQGEADGLAWAGGRLYATDGAGGVGYLYEVNPATGSMSRVGQMIGGQPWAGFAFDAPSGKAYYSAEGWTRELNLSTGRSTTIGASGAPRMWGNAMAPAIMPGAVAAAAGLCLGDTL